MFTVLKQDVENIFPERAKELLELNTYQSQRKLKKPQVKRYKKKMDNGSFLRLNISIAVLNGRSILVNGQHTLTALVEYGKPIGGVVTYISCETERDVAKCFRQFDVPYVRGKDFRLKTELDVLGVKWVQKCAKLFVNAMPYIAVYNGGYRFNYPPKIRDYEDWLSEIADRQHEGDFINAVFPYKRSITEHAFLPEVAAVAIITASRSYDKAVIFWKQVVSAENMTNGGPSMKLCRFLQTVREAQISKKGYIRDKREIGVKCIHAWNRFIEFPDKPLCYLKYHKDSDIPKIK